MDRFDQKNMRRRVARTLLVSTLVFFLLLGGAFYLQREIPLRRLARIEALLDAGDYAAARPLTERVDDEALAEGFRARCDYLEGVQLMDSGRWAEARELLARLAGLNLREGAAFDRAFPCKTLEGWIGALWDMSERGTGFNSPDALYYALQIAKRAGKHIIRLYDEPEFMRFQDVVSNHISKR